MIAQEIKVPPWKHIIKSLGTASSMLQFASKKYKDVDPENENMPLKSLDMLSTIWI